VAVIQERKGNDGKIKFRALVRLKGYPPQSATFERKTDAKKWAQDTESAIRHGRYFPSQEARKHLFSELVDRYIDQVLPHKPKMKKQQEGQLNWWKAQLGYYLLSDVSPALIGECRDRLLNEKNDQGKTRAPATVVRYLAAVSHAFTIAVNEWGWMESNPVAKVKRPKEPRGRVRFLDDKEREHLLAACQSSWNKDLYPIVVLALSTGMRQGEILNLSWKDIDLQRRQLVLHETKNNERRVVPVVGHALEVIKEHGKVRNLESDYVFPKGAQSGQTSIRKAWEKAVKDAELEDFKFHDLRHTAASYLAMNGATLAEIAEVLGHKTLQMVKRYTHLSEAHTSTIVEKMNAKIFSDHNH
jgi:integrase